MTTPIESFVRKECCLIDPLKVNAYIDIKLDPDNPTGIILDTSWGTIKLDLLSIVKAGETVTHLELVPNAIKYTNEAGDVECITGDELSRIISLKLLKDVDQDKAVSDGDVYIYNGGTNLFEPFDLKTFVNDVNTFIGRFEPTINQINNRIKSIEDIIYNYETDKTTKIPRANINVYGDVTNTNNRDWGIFSHGTGSDEEVINDQYFS